VYQAVYTFKETIENSTIQAHMQMRNTDKAKFTLHSNVQTKNTKLAQ